MTLDETEVQRRKREYWGRWIMQKREAAGFRSQHAFADAAGVSRVQVQRWEAGEVRPDENRIPAIAEALRNVATYHETMEAAGYMSDTPPIVAQRYIRLKR